MKRLLALGIALGVASIAFDARAVRVDGPAEAAVFLVIGDVVLTVENVARSGPAGTTYGIGETILAAPQALVFGTLAIVSATDRTDPALVAISTGLATFTGALAMHGIWSIANTEKSSRDIYGVSLVTMTSAFFLPTTLVTDLVGRPSRALAATTIAFTLPMTVATSYAIASDTDHRSSWIALTATSGALLAHGVFALLLTGRETSVHPMPVQSPTGQTALGFGWSGRF